MSYFLAIETATDTCSVCVAKDQEIIAIKEKHEFKSHSQFLTIMIDEAINEAAIKKTDIDAIIISDGPGSYTGLRIGASTAKGLCYALDIPLIKVSTLQSLAWAVTQTREVKEEEIIPMIDARRMEVFAASYDKEANEMIGTRSLILDEELVKEELNNKSIIFCGNGTEKCTKEYPKSEQHQYSDIVKTSSKYLIALGIEQFKKNQIEDIAYYEPNYHKEWTGK